MQAYTERLATGVNAARTAADAVVWGSQQYWRWVTRYIDPIGAAYGTGMAGASLVFLLYCMIV
jgi:hypothetical protein